MRAYTSYFYDDIEYTSEEAAYAAIMEDHPELVGEDLNDFFDKHVDAFEDLDVYDDELEEGEDLDK